MIPSVRSASENHVLLAADYSQIELRIIAHLSGDNAMQEAFRQGLDIHADTAARVYGVDIKGLQNQGTHQQLLRKHGSGIHLP